MYSNSQNHNSIKSDKSFIGMQLGVLDWSECCVSDGSLCVPESTTV